MRARRREREDKSQKTRARRLEPEDESQKTSLSSDLLHIPLATEILLIERKERVLDFLGGVLENISCRAG
jgi:hypothetical protein